MQQFLSEARRRRVFRVSVLYIVAAWILIQVAQQLFQAWGIPDQALRFVWIGAVIGFPLAAVFGWRYDITVRGIVRTTPAEPHEAIDLSLRRLDYVILLSLGLVAAAIVLGLIEQARQLPTDSVAESAQTEAPENSIAVLPFRNISDSPDNDYFSDGLAYELTGYLTRIPEFVVIASGSAFAIRGRNLDIKQIGNALQARYVIDGGVRKAGEKLRIDVQLVDTISGLPLWHETFDRNLGDVFALQTELAGRVITELQDTLGTSVIKPVKRQLTSVPEAYDFYLLGQHEYREKVDREQYADWLTRAMDYFERAIEADPDFAAAYVALAQAHMTLLWSVRAELFDESISAAAELLDKALKLDPESDCAYLVLARLHMNQGDSESRIESLRHALELNPANAKVLQSLARVLWEKREFDEAIDLIRTAVVRDPLNIRTVEMNADIEARLGNYDTAKAQLLRMFDEHPGSEPFGDLRDLEEQFGHLDEAMRWTYQSYQRNPDNVIEKSSMVHAARQLGDFEIAEAWLLATGDEMHPLKLSTRGLYLVSTGRAVEAAAELNQMIAMMVPPPGQPLNPMHEVLLSFGSFFNVMAGDYPLALKHYQRRRESGRFQSPVPLQIMEYATMAMVARELGEHQAAEEFLSNADELVTAIEVFGTTDYPLYTIARAHVHAVRGDDEQALNLFEQGVDQGYRGFVQLRKFPQLQKYQDLPRFKALLAHIDEDVARQRERAIENGWLVEPPQSKAED